MGLTVLMAFFNHLRITITQTLFSLQGEGSMGGNPPSPRPSPMQRRACVVSNACTGLLNLRG